MFTLTGTLHDHGDEPHTAAKLLIQPTPHRTTDTAGNVVYLAGVEVTTDGTGAFTVELVTADGLYYTVRSVALFPLRPVRFEAPADGATIDLADVTPVLVVSPFEEYARGASAYDVAVQGGYVGTEVEWVASLESDVAGPQGAPGDPSVYELRGTGSPEGTVTADPGTYYTDTAGTTGAWRWVKTTGTGNTGWSVVHGSVRRNIGGTQIPDSGITVSTTARLGRDGTTVTLELDLEPTAYTGGDPAWVCPTGFGPMPTYLTSGYPGTPSAYYYLGSLRIGASGTTGDWHYLWTWQTTDPWPTALPGT